MELIRCTAQPSFDGNQPPHRGTVYDDGESTSNIFRDVVPTNHQCIAWECRSRLRYAVKFSPRFCPPLLPCHSWPATLSRCAKMTRRHRATAKSERYFPLYFTAGTHGVPLHLILSLIYTPYLTRIMTPLYPFTTRQLL